VKFHPGGYSFSNHHSLEERKPRWGWETRFRTPARKWPARSRRPPAGRPTIAAWRPRARPIRRPRTSSRPAKRPRTPSRTPWTYQTTDHRFLTSPRGQR
jgi:hypothetical protein